MRALWLPFALLPLACSLANKPSDPAAPETTASSTSTGGGGATGGHGGDGGSATGAGGEGGAPAVCGDGVLAVEEECDDENERAADGCTDCMIEDGWTCMDEPSTCAAICGDGLIRGEEVCDDQNDDAGDGCSFPACAIEAGYTCVDEPSLCSGCSDGVTISPETCDDDNTVTNDGCSFPQCQIQPGWHCDQQPSVCEGFVYGAVGAAATVGSLYEIKVANAAATALGGIGFAVTGLAFSPGGVLYGTEAVRPQGGATQARLLTINTSTGAGTPVAFLLEGATNHPTMPDITFVGATLYGWTELTDQPVTINPATAAVTTIGGGIGSRGSGMTTDAAGVVYLAPADDIGVLYTVNVGTGAVTAGPTMNGAAARPLSSLAFFYGQLYAVRGDLNAGGVQELVQIDKANGNITVIGTLPSKMEAIASPVP